MPKAYAVRLKLAFPRHAEAAIAFANSSGEKSEFE